MSIAGKLTLQRISQFRSSPGESLLLYISDKCPVGCDHCSVSSTKEGARPHDRDLFLRIVEAIECESVKLVGISGGEPMVERWALTTAVDRLHEAGKLLVLYTSGVWGSAPVPSWILELLPKISSVVLSTDVFHRRRIPGHRLIAAAEAIARSGCHLIVQGVRGFEDDVGRDSVISVAKEAGDAPESVLVDPLTYGRGTTTFIKPAGASLSNFGRCTLLGSPTVRYDGRIAACCNEAVIMGQGPSRLTTKVDNTQEVQVAIRGFREDPVLELIRRRGPGVFEGLKPSGSRNNICEACWAIQDQVSVPGSGALVVANIASKLVK